MKVHIASSATAVPTSADTTLRGLGVLLVAVAALTGLAACGSDKSVKSASAETVAVAQEAPVPGGPTVNVTLREASDAAYVVTSDQTSVKAGKITFKVTDTGKKDHEMVILKLDGTAFDKLPIDSTTNKVSEDTNVGETGDPNLKPAEVRTFSADLPAGNYVMVCNIEKHYGLGMRTLLTVTP